MNNRHAARALARPLIVAVSVALGTAAVPSYSHDTDKPTVEAAQRAQTSQLFASPAQIRLVQEKLRQHGHDPGRVDGVWGDNTTAAVMAYQKEANIAPTGKLDTSLLSALEIGDVLEGETSSTFLDGLLSADRQGTNAPNNYPGVPLFVSPAHVAQIQYVLKERDLYNGPIDGTWGEGTAKAANQYRAAMGLEADQNLDIALLQSLNAQRDEIPASTQPPLRRGDAVALYAGPVTLRAMQRELSAKGHDAGAIDGRWGDETQAALREYQREHNLEATGTLTLPTLSALGIDLKETRAATFDESKRDRSDADRKPSPDSVASER